MSIATRIQAIEEHISNAYDSLNKLGVTANNKNIENIAGLIDEIYNNSPKTDYASGTDLTIEDTRIGKIDFKDTDTIEKIGLGATNQYTTTAGKNLLVYPYTDTTKTNNGITYTDLGDGRIKINGTATANSAFTIFGHYQSQTQINGNYVYGGVNENVRVRVIHNENGTYTVLGNSTGSSVSINKNTYTTGYGEISILNGTTVNDLIITPMLTETQDNNYEPYIGGKAIPNPDNPQNIYVVKDNSNIKMHNKNLLPNYRPETQTLNSVTLTNNGNGTFLLSGTASAYTQFIDTNSFFLSAGTYTLYSPNLNNKIILQLRSPDGYTTIANTGNTTSKLYDTFTLNTQTEVKARIVINASETNVEITPMIYAGNYNETTTFVLHKEQNYEINLSGKNLLNNTKSTTTLNGLTFTINDDKSVTITGTATSQTDFYLVGASSTYDNIGLNAGTYNLSGCINGSSSTYMLIAVSKNSSGTTAIYPVSTSSDGIAMEIENNYTFRIFIRVTNGTTMNTTIYPQLEKGSAATSYAPYFNIELCKTENYQDYIYKNGKNWYLHKEIGKKIVDGSTPISGYNTNVSGHYRYGINISDIKILTNGRAIPDLYCSHYKGQMVGNDGSWGAHQGIAIDNTHQRVYINDDTYYTQDATAYKTWIANNNLTIYYPLDTPTETQITDATLISQLDAWYNAQSMDDITYITVDGNLPIQLKLKALKK